MRLSRGQDLADHGVAMHQLDCELFELPAAPVDLLASITTQRDELIRYALELRPCYDRIGRIIGQLAGIFILARLGGRFEADWPAVSRVLEQTLAAEVELHAVHRPVAALRHHTYLVQAFERTAVVTRDLDACRLQPQRLHAQLDDWTRQLKLAAAMLSGAAVEQLGLMPVDFSQACCSCTSNMPPFNFSNT